MPGMLFGLCKGVAGLSLRPFAGVVESMSKGTQMAALLCLGRQGVQGRIMRRIYAPGTTRRLHDQQLVRFPLLLFFFCFYVFFGCVDVEFVPGNY